MIRYSRSMETHIHMHTRPNAFLEHISGYSALTHGRICTRGLSKENRAVRKQRGIIEKKKLSLKIEINNAIKNVDTRILSHD